MLKAVGLIPTRFNSRRLPGKSLKDRKFAYDHTHTDVQMAKNLLDVFICCDTKEVFQVAKNLALKQ